MNARFLIRRRRAQGGFTLIEVLIAALVLSIGLLGLAGLQTVTLKMNRGAYLRVQATNLAYEIADAMRANKGNAADYDDPVSAVAATCNPARQYGAGVGAAEDRAIWGNRLACLLPSGVGAIVIGGTAPQILVTITVAWDETHLGGDAGQSFSFTTEL